MAHQPGDAGFRTSWEAARSENPALVKSPKVVVETASIGAGRAEDQVSLLVGTVSEWGVRQPFENEKRRGVLGPLPDSKWVCVKLETLNEEGKMFHSWNVGTKHHGHMRIHEATVGCVIYVPLDGSLCAHMNIGRHVRHNGEYVQDDVRIRPYQPSALRGEEVEEKEGEEEEEEEKEEKEEEEEEKEEEEEVNEEEKEGEDLDNEGRGGGGSGKKGTANQYTQQISKAVKMLLKTTTAVPIQDWNEHARESYPEGLPNGLLEPIAPGVIAITMSPYGKVQCAVSADWDDNAIIKEGLCNVLWAIQVFLEQIVFKARAKISLGEKAGTLPPVEKNEVTKVPSTHYNGRRNHDRSNHYNVRLKSAARELHRLILDGYLSQREHSTGEVNVFHTYWC